MRGKDRVVLARDLSARLVVGAGCRRHRVLWDDREKQHARARTAQAAAQAAAPLVEICATCPHVSGACSAWAETDRYTGIAGGQAWINGKPRPTSWIARQSPQSLAS